MRDDQHPGEGPSRTTAAPNIVGGHLYLERDGRVLLGRRGPATAFAAEEWHVLAGHVEHESARACVVREAAEEAGLIVAEEDLTLVHTVHALSAPGATPRIQLFFRADRWHGEPRLLEPDRCTAWRWWPIGALPGATVPYTRAAIDGIAQGRAYTELGWNRGTPGREGAR
jgi:8-oxo-dGTP pyrophosphatase MutT (NUDIX family)